FLLFLGNGDSGGGKEVLPGGFLAWGEHVSELEAMAGKRVPMLQFLLFLGNGDSGGGKEVLLGGFLAWGEHVSELEAMAGKRVPMLQ
nr:hypothetical protein [Tanacetum cinerariifolium]